MKIRHSPTRIHSSEVNGPFRCHPFSPAQLLGTIVITLLVGLGRSNIV
jgi:hypothetical protein